MDDDARWVEGGKGGEGVWWGTRSDRCGGPRRQIWGGPVTTEAPQCHRQRRQIWRRPPTSMARRQTMPVGPRRGGQVWRRAVVARHGLCRVGRGHPVWRGRGGDLVAVVREKRGEGERRLRGGGRREQAVGFGVVRFDAYICINAGDLGH
jgi:hypothetical protein